MSTPEETLSERLQKILARAGLGSRRQIEKSIDMGQIKINHKVATLGQRVVEGDRIDWKNRIWKVTEEAPDVQVLMYHKPTGEVSTKNDPEGRKTVFDRLPRLKAQKWINIGRLDLNTSGLLLFTTDGQLANHMMHPSANIDREYACRIFGEISEQQIDNLKKGVMLEDGMASFSDVQAAGGEDHLNKWFHVVILEGKNREVRRLWESQGVKVSRLKRVRYGGVFLPKQLRQGQHRQLNKKELDILFKDINYTPAAVQLIASSMR
ncbi:23S rRNA pseudouridine(2605) synthase RluB [Marinicella sp. W31]|uniref:23S rRNA pseudouridine(2605) synthase RluB n=1 Tax=Marinicella sp. W31 TaxID=3023713 RepID=UPI0037567709